MNNYKFKNIFSKLKGKFNASLDNLEKHKNDKDLKQNQKPLGLKLSLFQVGLISFSLITFIFFKFIFFALSNELNKFFPSSPINSTKISPSIYAIFFSLIIALFFVFSLIVKKESQSKKIIQKQDEKKLVKSETTEESQKPKYLNSQL